jgi:DNA-binding transcriptional MerR regulator
MARHTNPSQSQWQDYPTQPTQSDPYEWQRQGGTLDTGRGNPAFNDRPATLESYGPTAGATRPIPTSADQSGGQRMYTREEVEKLVARELKRAGKREVSSESFRQMVDQQLAKLVDEHFKALQRGQQAQQAQQTQQTQQTQQPKTGETGYPKPSAYEPSPGPEDPPDKPKPGQPDPRGSYGHPDYPGSYGHRYKPKK